MFSWVSRGEKGCTVNWVAYDELSGRQEGLTTVLKGNENFMHSGKNSHEGACVCGVNGMPQLK